MVQAARQRSLQLNQHLTIGIDLGGTKVATALVDASGRILAEIKLPTVPRELLAFGPEDQIPPALVRRHIKYVVETMADSAVQVLEKAPRTQKLLGVGLASAGPMNIEKGTLDHPTNIRGWKVVPLVKLLSEALAKRKIKAPVSFQNDAIAAALGEGWVGSAKGCETYVVVTVGTGIGTGVIFNGRPAQSRGMGSEWGHMFVDCRGLQGETRNYEYHTAEGLASGKWLMIRAKERGFKGDHAGELAEAARAGDPLALELFRESSDALASLFCSLSLGFHLEKIIISGGMLAVRDCFLPNAVSLYQSIMKSRFPEFLAPVRIAKLGARAGVIGAARLPRMPLL
mgnify:CR=1 FL=1